MKTGSISTRQIIGKIKNGFTFIFGRVWIFTILAFLAILVGSIVIWWNCFAYPVISQEAVNQYKQNQKDYDLLIRETQGVIDVLKKRSEFYQQGRDYSGQRDLFKLPVEEDRVPNSPTGSQKSQGVITGTSSVQ